MQEVSMQIRPVTRADLPRMIPLMLAYIVGFYKCPDPGEDAVQELIVHLLEHPEQGIQFVAQREGVLIGFATLYSSFSTLRVKRIAILNDLYVHGDARAQKVGETLFRHCLSYVREQQYVCMQWETTTDNQIAQRLYEKMGGQVIDHIFYELS